MLNFSWTKLEGPCLTQYDPKIPFEKDDEIYISDPYIVRKSTGKYFTYRKLAQGCYLLLLIANNFDEAQKSCIEYSDKRNAVMIIPTYSTMVQTGFATMDDISAYAEHLMLDKISSLTQKDSYIIQRDLHINDLGGTGSVQMQGTIEDENILVIVIFVYHRNERGYLIWDYNNPRIDARPSITIDSDGWEWRYWFGGASDPLEVVNDWNDRVNLITGLPTMPGHDRTWKSRDCIVIEWERHSQGKNITAYVKSDNATCEKYDRKTWARIQVPCPYIYNRFATVSDAKAWCKEYSKLECVK